MSQKKPTPKGNRKSTNRTPAKRADINQSTAAAVSFYRDIHHVNLTVAIPYDRKNGTDEQRDVLPRIEQAELYAQLLEHPDCPDAFKVAFGKLFDCLYNMSGVDITDPPAVRVLLPLILNSLDGIEPATADGVMESLMSMRDAFANTQHEEILARQKGGAKK